MTFSGILSHSLDPVIIGFEEPRWLFALVLTVAFFLVLLFAGNKIKGKSLNRLTAFLGFSFIALALFEHPFLIFHESLEWSVHKALPLHLCAINIMITGVNCFIRKRWIWEIMAFWGIIGGFHSLLTPELPNGDHPYFYFFYYYKHGALLFMPIWFWMHYGFRFQINGWLKVYLITNFYGLVVFAVNWVLNKEFPGEFVANYFYLWNPPHANNPLIQGQWPWYLIPFQIVLFLHLLIINIIFRWREKFRPLYI